MTKLFPAFIAATAAAFAQPLPTPAPPGEIIGVGNFLHVVADAEKSVDFYQNVLGMDLQGTPPTGPRPYLDTPAIVNLYDAPGAQYRVGVGMVQGSPMRAELVEWKGVDRTPIHPRYQDPGAATLILTVRDLIPILARVKKAAAPIVTTGGEPVRLNDSKAIMLRDPDGFYVELIQPDSPPATPASNMLSVSFAFTVSDTERMMRVFRDALGFQPQPSALQYDKPRLALMGLPRAELRRTTALVPGTTFQIEFLEFAGIDRKPVHSRPRDPGSPLLRLVVRDLDSALKATASAGLTVASHEAQPVTLLNPNGGLRAAIAAAPDNLFIQLLQQLPKPPTQ
jgi:catechol 2,3-dioxygenase-like lactoylglutathione lyase family enzyme